MIDESECSALPNGETMRRNQKCSRTNLTRRLRDLERALVRFGNLKAQGYVDAAWCDFLSATVGREIDCVRAELIFREPPGDQVHYRAVNIPFDGAGDDDSEPPTPPHTEVRT